MKISATFLLAIGLASCAAPKAEVIAEAPANAPSTPALTQAVITPISPVNNKPTLPVVRNTRIRLPDILGSLPQDEELRSAPGAPKDGKATVIARPPEE